jgi:DtxR family Mn-dependent transcriptional regulator
LSVALHLGLQSSQTIIRQHFGLLNNNDTASLRAEALEHVISEKLEARIAAHLGNPAFDPHGDPIPAMDGKIPDSSTLCLADAPTGKTLRVIRLSDQNSERLRYVAELGLVPGAKVRVSEKAPFDGPISVQIGKNVCALDRRLAQTILVEY